MIKLSKRNSVYLILTLVLCGIILVYIYNNPVQRIENTYINNEEERIKNMIESLNGVSEVSVLLTFIQDGGIKASLTKEEDIESTEINGIAVCAVGGDDPVISEKIKSLICAAYDINDSMVFVCGK